jgi:hypothetical protein
MAGAHGSLKPGMFANEPLQAQHGQGTALLVPRWV